MAEEALWSSCWISWEVNILGIVTVQGIVTIQEWLQFLGWQLTRQTDTIVYGGFDPATAKICWYWWKLQYCNHCHFLSCHKNFMKFLVSKSAQGVRKEEDCIWVISPSHSKNMLVLVKITILQALSFFVL